MSNEVNIEVTERDEAGKNASRRLRHAGKIPAVVYGGGREPVSVQIDPRPIEAMLDSEYGLNTLINLKVGDRELKRMVMLREVQRHPVSERLMHADFVRVELDQEVLVNVPVELVGVAEGVKTEGGLIDFVTRELQLRVLPTKIPARLVVDISGLHLGQHVEAGEVELPEDVTLMTAPTMTICNCAGKASAISDADEAAGEDAEGAEGAEDAEATEAADE